MNSRATALMLELLVSACIAVLNPPTALGQARPVTATVVEAGPDHQVLELPASPGRPARRIVALANGLNYRAADDQLRRSEPVFEVTPQGGFLASRVQHPVRIAPDLNVRGAVALRTPGGTNLFSTPLAVTLSHGTNFAVIGVLTNCTGALLETNGSSVVFDNPFAGLCSAIVFTITENSWDQSVHFYGRIDPRDWGLPLDESTELSIWTEFYQPEQPRIQRRPVGPLAEQTDETLSFGEDFLIGAGYAFTVPTPADTNGCWAQVRKEYRMLDGSRFCLVESFPVLSMARGLLSLPECPDGGGEGASLKKATPKKAFAALPQPPPSELPKPATPGRPRLLAKSTFSARPAVVADYRATLGSGTTLLNPDVTYLVSTTYSCASLGISPGTVCKFKVGASIRVSGDITCTTTNMRPAWFVGIDTDSVGESMAGFDADYTGTNNPAGYAYPALASSASFSISSCRFAYAQTALGDFNYPVNISISATNCQFINCTTGVRISSYAAWHGSVSLANVLMANVAYPMAVPGSVSPPYGGYSLLNCTIDRASQLVPNAYPHLTAYNCIFANITNSTPATNGTFSGSHNAFFNTSQSFGTSQLPLEESPFQSVGAGHYYLKDSSNCRNSGGSSGLSAALRAERTTYPPVVIAATTWNSDQVLSRQVQRDTDQPDRGYLYDPLDFAIGWVLATNCTVTITPGTAIGTFGTNNGVNVGNYGVAIGAGATLQCVGAPNNPNWFVQYNLVQEQPDTPWLQTTNGCLMSEFQGASSGSTINCRFTHFAAPAQASYLFHAPTNAGPLNFQDCEFHGGRLRSAGPTLNLTNCLLEYVNTDIQPTDGLTSVVRNCLVRSGTFGFGPTNSVISDNFFFSPFIPNWIGGRGNTYAGSNAYIYTYPRLQPTKTDKILNSGIFFQTGPLGRYYLVSTCGLTNAGSCTADLVGLYHYTTTTNLVGGYQTPETNSLVDMSYHYVATDAAGNPRDSDGDTLPDYLENSLGNGTYGVGDLCDWQMPDTDGDGVSDGLEVLLGRNPIVQDIVPDTAGLINLRVYTPLK